MLFENNKTVSITPKAFDTLLFLVENCGHILSKEELLETVWEGAFVEENNLAQNISILRRIIGEDLIETVPRRGYRFVGKVVLTDEEPLQTVVHEKFRARIIYDDESADLPESINQIINRLPLNNQLMPTLAVPKYETLYAQNGDVNIAYQVIGNGELDIVFVMGWVSHLEYFWKEPNFAAFLNRLASFSRLILFDKRGTGLSDRVPLSELPTLEQRMEDVQTVMDAVGSKSAVLIGVSEGGPMCSLFAATYPERTLALVMIGTYSKRVWEEDYPWAPTAEEREKFIELIRHDWGKPVGIEERAPSMADDENFRDWWATYLRMGASPSAAVALTKMNAEIDVRHVLSSIRVPSLVIHRQGDLCLKVEEGRFVASQIPACKYVELEGIDHLPFVGNQTEILDEIESFLTGVRYSADYDRVLATVASIEWNFDENFKIKPELLEGLQNYIEKQIKLFKGRLFAFEENNLLVAFDGPARAVRCILTLKEALKRLNLETKIGIHTGECDVVNEIYQGIAVEVAKQIAQSADSNQVMVSRTVKDLVAGSGLKFAEYGIVSFPDLVGDLRLFTVEN